MGEIEKSNSLSITKKIGTADSEVERSRLGEWLDLTLGSMVRSQPELPLKIMPGSMATQFQGSVLMAMVHITTREHGEVPGGGSLWG